MQAQNRQDPNRTIKLQAFFSLLALALMLGVAAGAMQPLPEPASPELKVEDSGMLARQSQTPVVNAQTTNQDPQGQNRTGKSIVLTGTIARDGSDYVLRDQGGIVYHLDAPLKAKPYEGKPVRVTGKLQGSDRLIHVSRIEGISA